MMNLVPEFPKVLLTPGFAALIPTSGYFHTVKKYEIMINAVMLSQILFTRLVTKKQTPADTVDEVKVRVQRIVDAAHKSLHISIQKRVTTLLKIGILTAAKKEACDIHVDDTEIKLRIISWKNLISFKSCKNCNENNKTNSVNDFNLLNSKLSSLNLNNLKWGLDKCLHVPSPRILKLTIRSTCPSKKRRDRMKRMKLAKDLKN